MMPRKISSFSGTFLVLALVAICSPTVWSEVMWSGMFIVDKSSSIHAEAAREKPALPYPLVVYVDEKSQAFRDGFKSGDYILGTAEKDIPTASELESVLEKGKVPIKIQNAEGQKVVEFSPSPVTPEIRGFMKIRGYLRINMVKDGVDDIQKILKDFPKSPLVSFMGAFALGSLKDRDNANKYLQSTVRNAPTSLLARISKKRLPKEIQEKLEEDLKKPAPPRDTAPKDNPPAASSTFEPTRTIVLKMDIKAAPQTEPETPSGQLPSSIDQQAFTSATLDGKIEILRNQLSKTPEDKSLRQAFSTYLLKKASTERSKPYDELEPILREATDYAVDPFLPNYIWGDILFSLRNYEPAVQHLEEASRLNPDNVDCTMKLAFSLVSMLKWEDALGHFERARKKLPEDFFCLYYIAVCHFELKDYDKALETAEEAQKFAKKDQDKKAVQGLIQKIKEHNASSEGSTKEETSQFVVQFAGDSQKDIGEQVMEILQDAYDQVTSDLMYKPDIKINVLFFRTEDFYKMGKTPQWAGAMAQGEKILVPLREGYRDIRSVKGTLAHEFTHVIINLRTNQRCPTWIHEGLAVYEENKAAYDDPNTQRPDYEKVFRETIQNDKRLLPLNQIQLNHQTQQSEISLGYVESYLAMRFLIERWNWQGVDEMMNVMGQGGHWETGLEQATGRTIADFQKEFTDWVPGVQ